MGVKFANNASTLLTANITDSALTFDVDSVSDFPDISDVDDYMYLTLVNIASIEIIKVTGVSGNTLTCVRAQDGTAAAAFTAGDVCGLRNCAVMLLDALAEVVTTATVNAAGAIMESDLDDNSFRIKNSGSTTTNVTLEPSQFVARLAAGELKNCTVAEILTLLNIVSGAQPTDAVTVGASGAIMESDLVNNSLRIKNSSGVVTNVIVAASQIVARLASGQLKNVTVSELLALLNVAAGAQVNPALMSQAVAEDGTDNTPLLTSALKQKQAIVALSPIPIAVGWKYLNTFTASAASHLTIDSGITSIYNKYLIRITGLLPSASTGILRANVFKSAAWQTGTQYFQFIRGAELTNTGSMTAGVAATSYWELSGHITAPINGMSLDIILWAPALNQPNQITFNGIFAAGTSQFANFSGQLVHQAAAAMTGIRLLFNTGNTTGNAKLYGWSDGV